MNVKRQAHSPIEQVRSYRNDGAQIRYLKRQPGLEPNDHELLDHLLREPIDYMDSERLHTENAEQEIFDDSIEIPDPEVGWYTPVMVDLGMPRASRRKPQEEVKRLTSPQERALFYQFNYARFRARSIQDALGVEKDTPPRAEPSHDQARELLHWYRLSEKLRRQIVETNVGLVLAMIRRTSLRNVDVTDLVSEGNMALLRAINKFNPDYGFKFSTYACQSILKAFSRLALRTSKHKERFPVEHDPALEHTHSVDYREDERQSDYVQLLGDIVRDNRCSLTEVEKMVLQRRFGLSPDGEAKRSRGAGSGSDAGGDAAAVADATEGRKSGREPGPPEREMTLSEVGQTIGVGKERVRQIQLSALAKVRRAFESELNGEPVEPHE